MIKDDYNVPELFGFSELIDDIYSPSTWDSELWNETNLAEKFELEGHRGWNILKSARVLKN